MVRPERRTKGDLVAAAAIVVVVAVVAALFWWNSSARATISRPASDPAPNPVPARAVPDTLRQLWTATSPRTLSPIVVGGTVITGEGRTVTGHDPKTGQTRWTFARDTDLCGVSYVYDLAVAVYPDIRGCGQVSSINGGTGRRGPTRTAYADKQIVLSSSGSTVLAAGPTRLELWRSDLVRMLAYGEIDARVKPVNQGLGTGCTLMSAAASDEAVSVLEACRDQKDLRLTLLKPAKEEDEPDTKNVPLPGVATDSEARVLAVSGSTTAVYLPSPKPEIAVYDVTGTKVSSTLMSKAPVLANPAQAVTKAGDLITWWTGDSVEVFDAKLGYRYTINAAGPVRPVGPATMMGGRLLIPLTTGIGVYDPSSGTNQRVIPVSHPAGNGPVVPAVSGTQLIEQRGAALTVFGPPS
ncbi:PQQ-like beta-propeller repeat protein [Mycobacterium sp. NBC_00419]|uniref:Rv3212 family protein n=1 Tax=Mycobacterium sp. NBC_00419 TaxID=2975989 RepID=UPI002E1F71D6